MIIKIDFNDSMSIYEQLYKQIVLGISMGKLKANEPLPSVRKLAVDLGINMHTVSKAYNLLAENGYLHINKRSGAVVSAKNSQLENFKEKITKEIFLAAAEARCHRMDIGEFLMLCKECYDKTGKETNKNE